MTDTLRVQSASLLFLSVHQESPLHIATRQGDLHKVRQLIDEGIDINMIIDEKGVSTSN